MAETILDLSRAAIAARTIDDESVLTLRHLIWANDTIARGVLEQLFLINDALAAPNTAFTDLFCEAIIHFALRQSAPHNFITDETATWLAARLTADGRLDSHAELETVVHLLEQAENGPEALKHYALTQIEAAILTGVGPTRNGGDVRMGVVDAAEVTLLRRLIFAAGGDDATKVSAQEAEMLFRIKDATLPADNAPEWLTLFVQGVGNHLMAHSDYHQLSLDDAKRLNTAMDDSRPSLAGFLCRVVNSASLQTIMDIDAVTGERKNHWGDDAAIASDRAITGAESGWLKRQIAADAVTDDLEKALLAFIADETGVLDPELEALRRAG
jgi:hypothetical protein